MFEQAPHEMTANVFIENGVYQIATASNVAFLPQDEGIVPGNNTVTFMQAGELIQRMDGKLPHVQKAYFKRLRALRNQFVFAFGPEMEDFLRNAN